MEIRGFELSLPAKASLCPLLFVFFYMVKNTGVLENGLYYFLCTCVINICTFHCRLLHNKNEQVPRSLRNVNSDFWYFYSGIECCCCIVYVVLRAVGVLDRSRKLRISQAKYKFFFDSVSVLASAWLLL